MGKYKRILITGGAGFIGSCIVNKLVGQGHELIVVDDLSIGKKSLIKNPSKVIFYRFDISDPKKLENAFGQKVDLVIHLAAKHYIPYCDSHEEETVKINVLGTLNLIQLMERFKMNRIIFASSAAVYKSSAEPHREIDSLEPAGIYGTSKVLAEDMVKRLCPIFHIDYTILRLFNVYGPDDLVPHLIPEMIKQAKRGQAIEIGNLGSKRDYVWVQDVAEAFIKVMNNNNSRNNIYNVGTGRSRSVEEVFNVIKQSSGRNLVVKSIGSRKRKSDTLNLQADINKIKKEVGWSPAVDFADGVRYYWVSS